MNLLRERIGKGRFHIHAQSPVTDSMTLCGYAFEGSCMGDGADHGVTPVNRGLINCRTCLTLIRFCKAVPARKLAVAAHNSSSPIVAPETKR